jgi:hypothetical protein
MDGGLAASATTGAASAAARVATSVVTTLLFGSFNPDYRKLDQKRMRYIQFKYALAYGSSGEAEDPATIIHNIGEVLSSYGPS